MLKYLKQFFGLSKRAVFAFSLVLVLLVAIAIFIPHSAQAQDISSYIYNGILRLISNIFLGLGKFCISFAIFALKFFIAVAQYNGYLDAPTVMIGWIMVRDVANMFFVVALLMIAFGTILGLENYQWNKTLIKLVLSAILINFSNLICGIFIDIAHVFTITFVSAIAGSAGGNLINMFKLDQIYKIANSGAIPVDAKPDLDILIGSFAAFIFSLMAALIIGVYALIMLARMVALWVLIILSPLAFIFQVIPQTQQYAKQWWDYFGKYVIAAPVMVFFLWLAFATLGTGDIVSTLQLKLGENELAEITQQSATLEAAGTAPVEQSLSLSAVTTWTNMASFLIPLVLLVVGTKMVEQTGVFGGGMLSKAVDFGKKVATIASGYTAGRWLAGKVGEGAKAAGKFALMKAPVVGGESWVQRGKILKGAVQGWYWGKGLEITAKGKELTKEIMKKRKDLEATTPEGKQELIAQRLSLEDEKKKTLASALPDDEKAERVKDIDKKVAGIDSTLSQARGKTPEQISQMKEELRDKEKELKGEMGGGAIGWIARSGKVLEKQLKKTERQATTRREILLKTTGSEAGGRIFSGLLTIGMGTKGLFGTGLFGDKLSFDAQGRPLEAQDRVERGWLQAEEMRSRAKDTEFETKGQLERLSLPRYKKDIKEGLVLQFKKGSMMEQIQQHKVKAEGLDAGIKLLEMGVRMQMIDDTKKMIKAIKDNDSLKQLTGRIDELGKDITSLNTQINDLEAVEAAKKRFESTKAKYSEESEEYKKAQEVLTEGLKTVKEKHGIEEKKVDEELKKAREKKQEKNKESGDLQRNFAKEFENQLREQGAKKMPMWETARLQAKKEHTELFFKGKNKDLLSDAAQKHVWDQMGIEMPNDAQLEIIETLTKQFQPMNYEAAVRNAGSHMNSIAIKRSSGEETTFEDTAIAVALMSKLESGKWIDDAIIPIRKTFTEILGEEGGVLLKSVRGKKNSGGGGRGGIKNSEEFAKVLKSMAGDQVINLIKSFKSTGDNTLLTQIERLIDEDRGKISGIDTNTLKSAGLDAATEQNIAKEIRDILNNTEKNDLEEILRFL